MPWWTQRRPKRPDTPAARVAAVQPLDANWQRVASRVRQPWQQRCRFFAENLGVVRFANGLAAQTAARCDLQVERLVDASRREWEPVDDDPQVAELLATYQGPDADSPSDLVARHVWHYKTTGDAFQVVDQDPSTGELTWSIRSTQAVQIRSGYALVMDLPGGSVRDGTARELPIEQVRRLWVPDDEWSMYAKSPMRAVLADCERYWSLARRIRREAESVLTNGFLWTPGYAHKPSRPVLAPGDRPPSRFDLDYYAVAQQAWMDDDSVQAIAPLSVHYDHVDTNREPSPPSFIHPGRDMDGHGIEYRQEALESIARGLDLPMDLAVTGGVGANHWQAWATQEDQFKTNIAPTMDRVTHTDMTTSFLRPVLRELARQGRWQGVPDVYRVGYDPTPVIIHPDRAASSISLYGLGLIQGSIVMEANGYGASDMPDPAELARIMETMALIRQKQQPQGVPQGADMLAIGPSTTREGPPLPAMAALAPYPMEMAGWLDDWTPHREKITVGPRVRRVVRDRDQNITAIIDEA